MANVEVGLARMMMMAEEIIDRGSVVLWIENMGAVLSIRPTGAW